MYISSINGIHLQKAEMQAKLEKEMVTWKHDYWLLFSNNFSETVTDKEENQKNSSKNRISELRRPGRSWEPDVCLLGGTPSVFQTKRTDILQEHEDCGPLLI